MARKATYKFSDKIHPVQGVISVIIGVIAALMLFVLCILSSRSGGNGGIGIGGFGFLVFFLSIGGLVMTFFAFQRKEEEIHYSFPVVGALINGVIMITCLILYVVGACL